MTSRDHPRHALTLGQLISLPVLASVNPRVIHGADALDREVRWVHTSEIYDIAPLLKGGEALLTSGLGLVGAPDPVVRRYARSLAEAGVSAVLFEVGRTFHEVPTALREEISSTDVALVVLSGVTPFIDVTEAAHRILIEHEAEALRIADKVTSEFLKVLVNSGGVKGVLDTMARFAGAPISLASGSGQVVASTMTIRTGSAIADLPPGIDQNIEVYGNIWGIVRCHGPATDAVAIALERAAIALSLEMVRGGQALPARRGAQREFLADLMSDVSLEQEDIAARAASFGLILSPGMHVLTIGLRRGRELGETEAAARAVVLAQQILGPAIVGPVADDIVIIGVGPQTTNALARQVQQALSEGSVQDSDRSHAVFMQACVDITGGEWGDLRQAVSSVTEGLEVARRVQLSGAVLLPEHTSLLRLLRGVSENPRVLDAFVMAHLAQVLAYDASHGTELLRTIEAMQGGSVTKADVATALNISRQTLYDRLARIEELIGEPATTSISTYVATLAWRLQTRSHAAPAARGR